MIDGNTEFGLNAQPHRLTEAVTITGKQVDPFSGGFSTTDSSFTIQPSERPGITFRIGDITIPYDVGHLEGVSTTLGRMLRLEDKESHAQIVLVEHLLSALQHLGLNNVEIVLNKSNYGPLTSSNIPIFGLGQETYWIPVMGPGIEGFIDVLKPYCRPTGEKPEIITVTRERVHSVTEKGLNRLFRIEPADRLIIVIESAKQSDIPNNPHAEAITIREGDDLTLLLRARPLMRLGSDAKNPLLRYLSSKAKEYIIFLMNLRSFALTNTTYFKSRIDLTQEEVVARMFPEFREGQNEHLYHTAIADFLAELGVHLQGKHLHAKITLADTTHLFRVQALALLMPEKLENVDTLETAMI